MRKQCTNFNSHALFILFCLELRINENDVQKLNVKCKEVADKINDKAVLKQHLNELALQV